jgi:hypothetical protein
MKIIVMIIIIPHTHLSTKQEYSVQLTFREQWLDERLKFDDIGGECAHFSEQHLSEQWFENGAIERKAKLENNNKKMAKFTSHYSLAIYSSVMCTIAKRHKRVAAVRFHAQSLQISPTTATESSITRAANSSPLEHENGKDCSSTHACTLNLISHAESCFDDVYVVTSFTLMAKIRDAWHRFKVRCFVINYSKNLCHDKRGKER